MGWPRNIFCCLIKGVPYFKWCVHTESGNHLYRTLHELCEAHDCPRGAAWAALKQPHARRRRLRHLAFSRARAPAPSAPAVAAAVAAAEPG